MHVPLYKGGMTHDHRHDLQTITLRAGEQVFINGTLIEASVPSTLRISRQASVVRGAQPRRQTDLRRALTQLYQQTLQAEHKAGGVRDTRPFLLHSLNLLTTQMRTRESQAHCAAYATALACGDIDAALAALRHLSQAVRQGPVREARMMPEAPPQITLAVIT